MQYHNATHQFTRRDQVRQSWREFWAVLRLLNRRGELHRLVRWAARRRLAGPRRCYEVHLDDVERRLFRYRVQSPTLARWALETHRLKRLIFPPPRYPRRGAAAGYSRRDRK